MAKQRIVNTRFWDDSYIANLDPIEKLLFLYLLTNPLTNISGVYELPAKRVAFDTGIDRDMVAKIFQRFETDEKIFRMGDWIGIKNFIKYQTLNPKVKKGILEELKKAPQELCDKLPIDYHTLFIGSDSLSGALSNPDRLAHSNSNLNTNSNSNGRGHRPWKAIGEVMRQDHL